jgi:maltose-binding protein MalE
MTSIRYRWLIAFVVMAAAMTLAGVGRAEAAPKPASITAQIQVNPINDPVINLAIPAFEKKYGIKVNVERVSTDTAHEQLILDMAEKSSRLDLLTFPDEWAPEFINNGWIYPQDEFWPNPAAVAKDELGILYREPDFTNTMHKKLYMITSYPGAIILMYRTDVFAKAGLQPPKTVQEWEADAKKLNDPSKGFYGISMGFSTKGNQLRGNWMAMIGAFGGKLFDDKWAPVFNQKPGIDTALFIKRMLQYNPPAALANDYSEALSEFTQGRTAMLWLWSHAIYGITDPQQSKVDGKVGAVSLPAGPAGKSGLEADYYWAVSSYSKNKEWASKFIQTIHDPEIVKQAWLHGGTPPALQSVAKDPEVAKTFFTGPALVDQFKFASGYPRMSVWEYFSERAEAALGKIMASNDDPKQILDGLAADITVELKKAGYVK